MAMPDTNDTFRQRRPEQSLVVTLKSVNLIIRTCNFSYQECFSNSGSVKLEAFRTWTQNTNANVMFRPLVKLK
jgi:hypothetical protein